MIHVIAHSVEPVEMLRSVVSHHRSTCRSKLLVYVNRNTTLFILMHFTLHIGAISMDLSVLYSNESQVEISKFVRVPGDSLYLGNSAHTNEM